MTDPTLERLRQQVNAACAIEMVRIEPDELRTHALPPGFHLRIGDFLIRDERKAREEWRIHEVRAMNVIASIPKEWKHTF